VSVCACVREIERERGRESVRGGGERVNESVGK